MRPSMQLSRAVGVGADTTVAGQDVNVGPGEDHILSRPEERREVTGRVALQSPLRERPRRRLRRVGGGGE